MSEKKQSKKRINTSETKKTNETSAKNGWKIAAATEGGVIVVILLLFFTGILQSPLAGPCSGCCARISGRVDENFGIEIDGTLNKTFYVGNLEIAYMAISARMYDFILAHDFASIDELIAFLNDTYGLNNAYTSYFVWSYIEFEDVRAFFDDDQYDNISIDGESFTTCISAVAFVPYAYIEVFYPNGTTYDYFDFPFLTLEELAEITDLENPIDLVTQAPDRIILNCGETLTFSIIKVVLDTGEDPVVIIDVNGEEIEVPGEGFFMW